MFARRSFSSGARRRAILLFAVALLVLGLPSTAFGAKGGQGPGKGRCVTNATNLGPWASWVPPAAWTAEQVSFANSKIANTLANTRKLDTTAEVAAAGYTSIGDSSVTGFDHWVNLNLLDDGKILDPCHPESVVFQPTPTGSVLAAYMYILDTGTTMATIPANIAWLPGWHVHNNLCFDTTTFQIVGVADAAGNCPAGSALIVTPPMTHVWVIDNDCDSPWASVNEFGVHCAH